MLLSNLNLAAGFAEIEKSELELMGTIAENTTPNFLRDDLNLLVILSIIIAVFSLFYAIRTYIEQKKTQSNTKKLSEDAQRSLLNDLIRHLYRNFIICSTIRTKLDETSWETYPSDEHIIKLQIPLENIHLNVFYGNDDAFMAMHELYLNMRNYNEETNVAIRHFRDPGIDVETKRRDLGTLEFKAYYIVERIFETEVKVWKSDKPAVENRMKEVFMEAVIKGGSAKDNRSVEGYSDKFKHLTAADIENTYFFKLYAKDKLEELEKLEESEIPAKKKLKKEISDKLEELVSHINKAIEVERELNSRGEEKIHMIRRV